MKLYLAGPMRGYPKFNFPAFHEATAKLRAAGHIVISPAEMDEADGAVPEDDKPEAIHPFEWYISRDLNAILLGTKEHPGAVDAVAVLPGWQQSQGAGMETEMARRLKKPVLDAATLQPVGGCTVGRKDDTSKLRYDLIPTGPMAKVAEVYTIGAKKYSDRNWEKGIQWGRIYAAMQRHSTAFWGGERLDSTDGQHHLASVVWCALALMEYERTHPELDDRKT